MRDLTINQQQAIEKLQRLKVGALFMACGTGKTQTAVALINSVPDVDCLYWLCPCQVKETLETELEKCGCKYKAHIMGIESIGCSDRIYLEELEYVKQFKRVFMVADESIKIKNMRAKRTQRIMHLGRFAEYKVILNGTPVTKNICDIYAQMQFLSPKILPYTFYRFRDRYCTYTQHKRGGRVTKTIITGYANIDHLLSLVKPYVFQCNLELKVEKKYHVRYWNMTWEENEAYRNLKACLFYEYINRNEEENLLAIFSKLQHSYCLSSEKWEILDELLTDKSIVFCKYIDSRNEVQRRYPDAVVLTYGKGSFGLNLQRYNRIIYFDKTFDYSFREQSEGRIYRNGQTLDCEYFDLTGDIGLERMIDECISKKESLVNHFKKQGNLTIKDL